MNKAHRLGCVCGIGLVVVGSSIATAEQQIIHGHVPPAVKNLGLNPLGRLPTTNQLRLAIALPLRNVSELTRFLSELYDPASVRYRRYLTPEQFAERFGPTEDDYQALIAFAEAQHLTVTARYSNRVLLDVSGSVSDVERALHLSLHLYQHPKEDRTFYAPDREPSLDISIPVLSVSGLDNFALPRPSFRPAPCQPANKPFPLLGSGPGGTYMGNDFRQAYVPSLAVTGAGQNVALLEFDGFYSKDISDYENLAGLPKPHLKTVLLDGFRGTPGNANVEVALDIEMAVSMASGLSQIIVYEAGPTGNWHDILNQMATDNLAHQLSCSWYSPGAGPDPVADQIFQQMAAQGQSFFTASGDYDAYSGLISFPMDNPYITTVGGTTLSMSTNGGAYSSETVWNWNNGVGSGGGVSTSYLIPSWQRTINVAACDGSPAWRNVPDVAMTADNVFVIANNGQQGSVGGTSCAAPLWAAFTALVNQQALAAGKPVVGFINPAIYTLGAQGTGSVAFHDITTGNNTNSSSPSEFFAVPGYDLCTGWGSPNGQELLSALAGTDGLSLTGPAGFVAAGVAGGPFNVTVQDYSLQNSGSTGLSWAAAADAPWLAVSPAGGTLATGQSPLSVSVSLNSVASNLTAGFYSAHVWFTNTTTGFLQARNFALAVAQSRYGGAVLTFNPAAYWPLNETNPVPPADVVANSGLLGTIANGFGLDGPIQGEPGIVGQSFRFSNSSLDAGYFGAHVDVPYNPALNPSGPFTVELWAMPAQAVYDLYCAAASVDASQNGGNSRFGWVLYQSPTNWEFRLGGGLNGYTMVLDGNSAPQTGGWNHVVGLSDGTNVSLYVNGQLDAGPVPVTGFAPNTNSTVPLRFGATTFTNREFDGWVDEVALYTIALTPDRLAVHYTTATTSPGNYAAQILADQPAGYWHLDEAPYTSPGALPAAVNVGLLGSALNGTYEPGCLPGAPGVPSAAFGLPNFACAFNSSGSVNVPGWALSFPGPMSLVLWTKANPATGYFQTLASKGSASFQILLDGAGFPHFNYGQQPLGDLVGPARIDDGLWHQLAGIYDGFGTEALYVDGLLAASSSGATNPVVANGIAFSLGVDPDNGLSQFFNGVVDEVCLFTNALTAAQVGQLFSAGNYVPALPPVFQHLERSGTTLLLTWSAVAGRSYQLQYKAAVTDASWTNLGTALTATNTMLTASDTIAGPQRLYRVALLP